MLDGSPQSWADQYGITAPVLADPGDQGASNFVSGSYGIPYYALLDRELNIVASSGNVSPGMVQQMLEEPMPEVAWPMPDPEAEVIDGTSTPDFGAGPFSAETLDAESPLGGASCASSQSTHERGSLGLGLLTVLALFGWRRRD